MDRLEIIANRVKGEGDSWIMVSSPNQKVTSLTQALEVWFNKNQVRCPFRLDPIDGKLFAILDENLPEPAQKYNLYGDPE